MRSNGPAAYLPIGIKDEIAIAPISPSEAQADIMPSFRMSLVETWNGPTDYTST
jgi:hypothetical protein